MNQSRIVAEKLLQVKAVQLRPDQPFTWASGWRSPIYCDNRKILSFPYIRDYIKSELSNLIFERFPDTELIAGVATAGIAWGTLAADQLKLPFVYVRPKPKEHGLSNQIEGYFERGQKTVIVEDLVSTGKSSLQVAETLRKEGLKADWMVSIFSYGFPAAEEAFSQAGVEIISLTNYQELIGIALEKEYVSGKQEDILLKWRDDPAGWGR